jgi:hypothetical protein
MNILIFKANALKIMIYFLKNFLKIKRYLMNNWLELSLRKFTLIVKIDNNNDVIYDKKTAAFINITVMIEITQKRSKCKKS